MGFRYAKEVKAGIQNSVLTWTSQSHFCWSE